MQKHGSKRSPGGKSRHSRTVLLTLRFVLHPLYLSRVLRDPVLSALASPHCVHGHSVHPDYPRPFTHTSAHGHPQLSPSPPRSLLILWNGSNGDDVKITSLHLVSFLPVPLTGPCVRAFCAGGVFRVVLDPDEERVGPASVDGRGAERGGPAICRYCGSFVPRCRERQPPRLFVVSPGPAARRALLLPPPSIPLAC